MRSPRRKGSVISDYTYLFMQPGDRRPGPGRRPLPQKLSILIMASVVRYWYLPPPRRPAAPGLAVGPCPGSYGCWYKLPNSAPLPPDGRFWTLAPTTNL